MTAGAADLVQRLRTHLSAARALKRTIRDAPDRIRCDAAIVDYTRTLDLIVEDLIALDEIGALADCAARLEAERSSD